ncbi:hypothetical protein GCM10010435_04390 [Winogradskya consettensis]|uniref:glycoside hydrolase family 26 protein n=1 Tax=Winogradskya consettensis TaxID=113560 RepID=UPI001BB414E1|nr:glycosyl hydrolase [Actinoplanes consettensis]
MVAAGATLLVLIGLAIAFTTTSDDDEPAAAPTVSASPSASAFSLGPAVTAFPSPSPSPSLSPPSSPVDPRSARRMLALSRPNGTWPGAHGLSGVNGDPSLDTPSVKAFCTARGRPCTVAQTYTDRSSWSAMTAGTGWTFENFADFDGVLVISQGLVPDGDQADLAACAAGDHDADFKAFGTLMRTHNRADSIIRLGWEFNEQTSSWRADDTTTWLSCYHRAADSIRATNPSVLFDWTINAHDTPDGVCGGLSTNCYPGDDYVDIVGIDNYDHYPWSPTAASFDRTAAAPEGLTWLYNFARKHNKPFSVGEWGVVPTADVGKENPNFITWMHTWLAAHAQHLAYETYFSDCGSGGVQSSLYRTDPTCTRNPASARRYASLFGA